MKMESGKLDFSIFVSLKAYSLMNLSDLGTLISLSNEQCQKAPPNIFIMESGKLRLSSFLHPLKQFE